MRSFKDIKKFEDIDTYYNILELVSEIFIDRVEAHKHLVSTNKEIERLNNIIDEAIHYINLNQDSKSLCLNYNQLRTLRGILRQDEFYLRLFEEQLKELKGSDEE